MSEPLRVLYIAGWGRSGSTILNMVLGQVPGFFPAGELRFLWQRNLLENHDCGCGEKFHECEIWRGVVERSGVDRDPALVRQVRESLDAAVDDKRVPELLRAGGREAVYKRLGPAADALGRLYRGIRDQTGCRVIVDASKVPSYGALLEAVPGIDLRVLHLVRDARAVAYSWLRKKPQRDVGRPMVQRTAFESGWRWAIRNAEVGMLWRRAGNRFLRLRYETLIDRPEDSLQQIVALAGEDGAPLPFVRPGVVTLQPTHTSSGNPNRFTTGETELRRDEEWRRGMRRADRWIVSSVAWPLMHRYGYRKLGRQGAA